VPKPAASSEDAELAKAKGGGGAPLLLHAVCPASCCVWLAAAARALCYVCSCAGGAIACRSLPVSCPSSWSCTPWCICWLPDQHHAVNFLLCTTPAYINALQTLAALTSGCPTL
jgi:hypothetical protein